MKFLESSISIFMLGIWAASFVTEAALSDNSFESKIVFPQSFSPRLMQKIFSNEDRKNVVYSPFSINVIIALLVEACERWSETYKELISALPDNFIYEYKQEINRFFRDIKEDPRKQISVETRLYSRNVDLLDYRYYKTVKHHYYTDVENLNSVSADSINEWVESVTKGNLKNFLTDDDLINANMVLINVLYFKAAWLIKFTDTFNGKFYINSEEKVEVTYMTETYEFLNYDNGDVQVIQLPYEGDKYSMIIVLPQSSELTDLIASIDESKLAEWQSQMTLATVEVTLPKFKFSSEIDLKKILQSLGINNIFTEDARLTKLGNTAQISTMMQKAGIAIDEHGTVAYAATSVIENKIGEDYLTFKADHPFLFLIQENTKQEIIFAGKIMNPNLNE